MFQYCNSSLVFLFLLRHTFKHTDPILSIPSVYLFPKFKGNELSPVWRYTFFLLRSLKKGLMSSLFTPRVAEGGYKITNWYRQWKCAHRRLCKAIPHSERHWQGETWGYNSHHWSRTVFQILGGQGSKKPTPEVVAIRLSKVCPAEQTISNPWSEKRRHQTLLQRPQEKECLSSNSPCRGDIY